MTYPIKDCQCEDFPCCVHTDNFPSEPEYCEACGGWGHNGMMCQADWDEDEEDDAPDYDPGPECDDVGGMSEVEWPMPIGSEEF